MCRAYFINPFVSTTNPDKIILAVKAGTEHCHRCPTLKSDFG
jgi:hypothetical protein